MKEVNELIDNRKDIIIEEKKSFMLHKEDKDFAYICYTSELCDDELMKYTSKIAKTCEELKNCKGCKGLEYCKNMVKGYIDYPKKENNSLIFSYTPCKYKKEKDKNKSNVVFYETSKLLREANFKDIYLDDQNRKEILNYIKKFMNEYPKLKGVYLYGSFGSGKSYILNALLNELSKKKVNSVSIYYPTLLKKLKDSFNNKNTTFEQLYNELETCDCLLIDDIGAENNTVWARDEILGSLLQSRMDNDKITFFTSNLNLEELEEHLSLTSSSVDIIKARRIIERIKQLCVPISLISENKRELV